MVTPVLVVRGLDELLAGLDTLPETLAAANEAAMREAALLAEAEIKALTPRKTGRLFSAWGERVTGAGFESVGIVADEVSYAPYVEEGTSPHDIVAQGNALMIPVAASGGFGGGTLAGGVRVGQQFALFKRVHHPGTQGKHMARQGLENATPGIIRIFELAMQRVLDTVKGL